MRHFLEPLGTGAYTPCIYQMPDGQQFETPFIQEVILRGQAFGPEDRVTVFLTKEARERNWYDRPYQQWEIDKLKEKDGEDKPKVGDIRRGLKSRLEELFPDSNDRIKEVSIPEGFSTEEFWEIFDKVYAAMDEDEEIIFDITHGFRSIPMLALTVLNYTKAIKHIQVSSIYYGCFIPDKPVDTVFSVLDLTPFDEILNWSMAADSFVRYGNSRQIHELCFQENAKRCDKNDYSLVKVRKAIDGLDTVISNIETGRGDIMKQAKKSIYTAYQSFKSSMEKAMEVDVDSMPMLENLMDTISDSMAMFDCADRVGIGMAVVDWSEKNRLTQQGFTALDETIKTYLCSVYSLSETEEDTRDGVVKTAINCIDSVKLKHREKFEENGLNGNRSFLWNQIKNDSHAPKHHRETFRKIIMTIPDEWVVLSKKCADYRNDINHFGFTKTTKDSSALHDELKFENKQFKALMEKTIDLNVKDETDSYSERLVFVNCSNHPSKNWGMQQLEAAHKYGEVVDVPFPAVNPDISEADLEKLAQRVLERILSMQPQAVMCQGEFTLTHLLVSRLMKEGIVVLSACSTRDVVEKVSEDGKVEKLAVYDFSGFRTYRES